MIPRFYVDAALRAGSVCLLSEDSAHHAMHVLRLREGDEVTLFNGRGGEYAARIAAMQRLKISIDVLERMDSTVRKAVELGVAHR
jgi:16S rRNA (uracil1498-N3)-methyltransferase